MDLRGIEDSLAVEVLYESFLKTKILGPLFLWAPILGWGPFGFIITLIVTKIAGKIFKELKDFSGNLFIKWARDGLKGNLDEAGAELAVIALEKGIESPEFKAARKVHKDALSKFARFGKPKS